MKLKTKLRKPKNRNKHSKHSRAAIMAESPYRMTFHRVNDSVFTGVKYAEIYPDWEWVHGNPMKVIYAFTWSGLNRKINKWLYRHAYDIRG